MMIRILTETGNNWYMARLMLRRLGEIAYIKFGISGLQAEIEFPSDWHESKMGWVRFGFGLFKLCFAFPWKWVVPDNYQCSGPTYGFNFVGDGLHLSWGKGHGKYDDPFKIIYMPWHWTFKEHKILTEPETHNYIYILRSGEAQHRKATIFAETRSWTRWWIPSETLSKTIDVHFDGEVGEETGSWKGGTTGCGYDMLNGEIPLDTLRRMERERKF